ncbi:hypothetical protein [Stieleria varia]|uniref:Uncharacterized protein n=1 Tax=Stieleria varia TaxID=2528005 RepID=A0A5C6B730_9BACT|nr:hypothetical protein [Stieleria varia]TWU07577.1 hypothetical protein Pla52n_01500 [Stieleria varia]
MRRFSIRRLLLATTVVAVFFGLYAYTCTSHAHNVAIRAAELRSINSIVGMFGAGQIVVTERGGTYAFDGSIFHLHDDEPPYARFYGYDTYRRVTNIHFRGDVDPHVVDYLPDFRNLRSVSFSLLVTVDGEFPPRFLDLLSATIDFRTRSPDVSVSVTCTDTHGNVVFDDS